MAARKPKAIKIKVVPRADAPDEYDILDDYVARYHDHLAEANISIAWHYGWKADPDGRLTLGKFKKASDLDYQLHNFDWVLLLNWNVWSKVAFTLEQKRALIDHELCHGEVARYDDGDEKRDEKNRLVWRVRKHDLEEFREVVERHGCWKADIEAFTRAALRKSKTPLLEEGDGSVCSSCGAKTTTTMTLHGEGRDPIGPVCQSCMEKVAVRGVKRAASGQ